MPAEPNLALDPYRRSYTDGAIRLRFPCPLSGQSENCALLAGSSGLLKNPQAMSLQKKTLKTVEESSLLKSSLLSLSLVLLFTAVGFGLFKVCSDRQSHFEQKLAELEAINYQKLVLQTHNIRMRERIEYLKTDEGVEEVVREKLGLVRPGELAYSVVPPPPPQFSSFGQDDIQPLTQEELVYLLEDHGVVVKVLRHLFGRQEAQQKVS